MVYGAGLGSSASSTGAGRWASLAPCLAPSPSRLGWPRGHSVPSAGRPLTRNTQVAPRMWTQFRVTEFLRSPSCTSRTLLLQRRNQGRGGRGAPLPCFYGPSGLNQGLCRSRGEDPREPRIVAVQQPKLSQKSQNVRRSLPEKHVRTIRAPLTIWQPGSFRFPGLFWIFWPVWRLGALWQPEAL